MEGNKQADRRLCRTRAARSYNLSHVPELIHPQCSGIKHPLKSVVLPRQSAAHNQLLVFAPSISQLILKKKKKKTSTWYSQEYTNIYHSFLAHYKISYKSLQHIMYKLYPNAGGAIPWHSDTASMAWSCCQLTPLLPLRIQRRRCPTQCHQ